MEDIDNNTTSSGFESLFIQEQNGVQDTTCVEQRVQGNTAQPGRSFTATQPNDSPMLQPYLQNMDDLLKSCEQLTGIPFGSRFSASFAGTRPTQPTRGQNEDEVGVDRSGETRTSPQTYLPTNYIDTHVDRFEPESPSAPPQSQGTGSAIECGLTPGVSDQTQMPLTAAGTKLSDTMVDYEGQLLGMLAMLESCMDAGMDIDPQGRATDVSQEYVQISKNPSHHRRTTPAPGQPRSSETEPVPFDSWVGQCMKGDEDKSCEESKHGVAAASGSMEDILWSCDTVFSVECLGTEREVIYKANQRAIESHFSSPGQSVPLEGTENEQRHHDETNTEYMTTNWGTADFEMDHTGEEKEFISEGPDMRSGVSELEALGSQLEECIDEVQSLEKKRKELLTEVLKLRGHETREEEGSNEEEAEARVDAQAAELMEALKREAEGRSQERQREIQSLREERIEEEKRMWRVNLERQAQQEELRRLKRRLFTTARDCAHSQAALNTQRHQVDLLKRDEDKLQSLVSQLSEESLQLRSAHQQRLSSLKAELQAQRFSQTCNAQEELTECRRNSCGDVQQYLQDGLKALEDRYEPILLALLKRRDATAGALLKAKEQAQELRAKLGPLRDESQKLKLQRSCLEEKLKLIHIHRRENVERYKETVYCLEENNRELKTELKIQTRKTKEMEELKDSLAKQLRIFRTTIDGRNVFDNKDKT